MNRTALPTRVVVIGLDGVGLDLIWPWVEEGLLPNLRRLISSGTYGELRSTIPPISAPAWVSLVTGKTPGQHGIIDFTTRNGEVVNSTLVRDQKIWQILSKHGRSCCIVNVPVTYPPEPVNGCMVSAFPMPPGRRDYAYPSSIVPILDRNNYEVDLFLKERGRPRSLEAFDAEVAEASAKRLQLLGEIRVTAERRYKTIIDLLRLRSWDFIFVVFTETDVIQHFFWEQKDVLLSFLQQVDSYVGRIVDEFERSAPAGGSDDYVVIVSDHGFGEGKNEAFNVGSWLNRQRDTSRQERIVESVLDLLRRLLPRILLPSIRGWAERLKVPPSWLRPLFVATYYGIYIDRERLGSRAEYEGLREKLVAGLRDIRNPTTLAKVFQGVWRREDLYAGRSIQMLPDIIYMTNPNYIATAWNSRDLWIEKAMNLSGSHFSFPQGMIVFSGKTVKKHFRVSEATVYDVTPTILHMFGLPIPRSMDGKLLRGIFDSSTEPYERPVAIADDEELGSGEAYPYTPDDEEKIRSRLGTLGYL